MAAERPASPQRVQILILDPDEERGRSAGEALSSCGFPALSAGRLAAALDSFRPGSVSVLVIERGATRPAPRGGAAAALDAAQIARLRQMCGAPLVIEWDGGGEGAEPEPRAPWAEESIRGLPSLVGRVALHAAESNQIPSGEMETILSVVREAQAAAHDLSQPLTTILARAQLLLAKMPENDPLYRPLSIIAQEAERLAQTVQRLQVLRQIRHRTS